MSGPGRDRGIDSATPTPPVAPQQLWDELWSAHRERLWGLCYRLTGSATEAEDLVQETFRRALERPPTDETRSLRPWLVTVATNLSIDALRRRKLRAYDGPWLPEPVDSATLLDRGDGSTEPEALASDAERRYSLLESATLAFLVALEVLSPSQRAVLVLRDAFGYSGPETAAALGLSPENVRVLLHRARKLLADYDRDRVIPSHELDARTRAALQRFMVAMQSGDPETLERCLAADVRTVNDAGGKVRAARKMVLGADRVARLYTGLLRHTDQPWTVEMISLNGLPALRVSLAPAGERDATRAILSIELDEHDRIRTISVMLNPDKLGTSWAPRSPRRDHEGDGASG